MQDCFKTVDSDNTSEYTKRRRSVVDGCYCDLDSLPERFVLFKIEKQIDTIIETHMNKKFYELDKNEWLSIKRTMKELSKQIKELKDN